MSGGSAVRSIGFVLRLFSSEPRKSIKMYPLETPEEGRTSVDEAHTGRRLTNKEMVAIDDITTKRPSEKPTGFC